MRPTLRGRDDSVNESGSRAYALAERGLKTVRDYCEAPSDARDGSGPITGLLQNIDDATQLLREVRPSLRGGYFGRQGQEVLDAIASAEATIVDVHVKTHVQEATGSATELIDLRNALAHARADEMDSE